jgi:hypothetical protein
MHIIHGTADHTVDDLTGLNTSQQGGEDDGRVGSPKTSQDTSSHHDDPDHHISQKNVDVERAGAAVRVGGVENAMEDAGVGAVNHLGPRIMSYEEIEEDVHKWLAKAPGIDEYADLKDFFDLKIVNDDSERAYKELREYCLKEFYQNYNAED